MGRAAKRAANGAARFRAGRDQDAAGRAPAITPPPRPAAAAERAADAPRWLRVGAAWSWRLLVLAALLYVAEVASLLYLLSSSPARPRSC